MRGRTAWPGDRPSQCQTKSSPKHGPRGRARSILGAKTQGRRHRQQLSEPPLQNGVALLLMRHGTRRGSAPAILTPSSGFLPGVCGVAVGYPLDTVKVRGNRLCSALPSRHLPLPALRRPCEPPAPHPRPEELPWVLITPGLPTRLRTVCPFPASASGFSSYMGLTVPALPLRAWP